MQGKPSLGGEPQMLDEEVEKIGIQAMLDALTVEEREEMSDPSMPIRHFRAEKGNATKAIEKLRQTLKWRREFEVDKLTKCTMANGDDSLAKIIAQENDVGKMYVRGYTKHGRALIYMRGDREQTNHELNNMRHLVWNLEKAIACTKRKSQALGASAVGLEKVILIMDFTHFSMATAPPMSVSKHTLHILQSHYPERVQTIYCFNAPFIFKAFWSMVKHFVDPATKRKIVFVNESNIKQDFHVQFDDLSALEEVAGGTAIEQLSNWDSEAYLNLPFDVAFDERSS